MPSKPTRTKKTKITTTKAKSKSFASGSSLADISRLKLMLLVPFVLLFAFIGIKQLFFSSAAPANFVYSSGTKLMLNGQQYKFNGHNNTIFFCGTKPSDAEVDSYFKSLAPRSMTRMWIFNGQDLTYMDKIVAKAKAYNQYLLVTLSDQGGGCDSNVNDSFYTSGYNGWFANWVKQIVPRYKNESTIAMWEMMNEPKSTNIVNVTRSFSDLVRSLDPNHLITTGAIAEYGYGAETYKAMHNLPNINLVSVHEYDQGEPVSHWVSNCVAVAKAVNKPCFVGEWGIYASQNGNSADRLFGSPGNPCVSWSTRNTMAVTKMQQTLAVPEVAGMLGWSWFSGTGNASQCELSYRQNYSFFTTINNFRGYPNGTTTAPTTPGTPTPTPIPTTSATVANDAAFTYTGTWQTSTGTTKYKSDDHYSSTASSSYSYAFSGTQISLYASKAGHHGIMAVKIDSGTETMIDLYSATRQDQVKVYTSPLLSAGNHTITVRVTGNKNASSTGTVINADRADVVAQAATVLKINDTSLTYGTGWQVSSGTGKYNSDDHYTATANANAKYSFTGTGVKLYSAKAGHHGIIGVKIDNGTEKLVDLYSSTRKDQQLVYDSGSLSSGAHTITLRATGMRNGSATGTVVQLDRLDISQ